MATNSKEKLSIAEKIARVNARRNDTPAADDKANLKAEEIRAALGFLPAGCPEKISVPVKVGNTTICVVDVTPHIFANSGLVGYSGQSQYTKGSFGGRRVRAQINIYFED